MRCRAKGKSSMHRNAKNPVLSLFGFGLSLALASGVMSPRHAQAQASAPTPDAGTVYIEKDCEANLGDRPNCVESLYALDAWIWGTRRPSEANPLVIRIGPGRHQGTFFCPDLAAAGGERAGWVSIIGSGRGITTIGDAHNPYSQGAVIFNCEGLAFSNLSIEGNLLGVRWTGGGSATWTDVDIRGARNPELVSGGWVDYCQHEPSEQSFFGSSIRSFGATPQAASATYRSSCAKTRFFGGDIQLLITDPNASTVDGFSTKGGAIVLGGQAELEVYGTSVRVGNLVPIQTSATPQAPAALFGVTVEAAPNSSDRPSFRMHGGIISMNAKTTADTDLVGLRVIGDPTRPADQNAYVNTAGTAFVLNPSGLGLAERVRASHARVDAPMLWQAGPNPPSSQNGDLGSANGQGIFVETDCTADGSCSAGDQSHLMVYDTSCAEAGPWRDVMTNACRSN